MRKRFHAICWVPSLFVVTALLSMIIEFSVTETLAAKKGIGKPLEKAYPHSQKCKRCHLRVFELSLIHI